LIIDNENKDGFCAFFVCFFINISEIRGKDVSKMKQKRNFAPQFFNVCSTYSKPPFVISSDSEKSHETA
jgi:hypothetical protein